MVSSTCVAGARVACASASFFPTPFCKPRYNSVEGEIERPTGDQAFSDHSTNEIPVATASSTRTRQQLLPRDDAVSNYIGAPHGLPVLLDWPSGTRGDAHELRIE